MNGFLSPLLFLSLQSLLGRDEKSKNVFYWKAGSIGILLIGALIECIANEIEDYHIWNVSIVNFNIYLIMN